jgi:hypothetical protein
MHMTNNITTKRFRVTFVEWVSYRGTIDATDADAAKEETLRLCAENIDAFVCKNSGLEDLCVEEVVERGVP